MHFVPTKKRGLCNLYPKIHKRTEKSRLFKNLNVFCTQLQNIETLSLPLNYNITIYGICSSNGSFLPSVVLVRIYLCDTWITKVSFIF